MPPACPEATGTPGQNSQNSQNGQNGQNGQNSFCAAVAICVLV